MVVPTSTPRTSLLQTLMTPRKPQDPNETNRDAGLGTALFLYIMGPVILVCCLSCLLIHFLM